ncbi:transport protein Avl9-domain-containing protein [Sordaria brevicollis]|uniref:Transport protein Avl9-domain-containing protein n=1 Tax=Sordaria brevicollis TaxID=83679 RepID=A0AAE0PFF8_SORBR|nr:transport protein Avl9-domain-containing protein [Sordaria brevicollis]
MSVPPTPTTTTSPKQPGGGFIPLVAVVDFHHARGPEVERWFGVPEGYDPAAEYDWGLLPFMALSDGAHAATEDFSYFTLLRPAVPSDPSTSATSLFGISCTRQMDASALLNRPADVTRSTVQKAVVIIADSPQYFGMLRERLSVVTKAWFAQREFSDVEILRRFQESLADEKARGTLLGGKEEDRDLYLGMSLRELVREFRWQTLVLLKCCLLQPKMLFFGSRCERLCMMQFSLISLIPGLLRNLCDSAGPELDNYERNLQRPTSLRTSDRNSLLAYMGLPLQIFGKGSLFGPYTPLQQLDVLADFGTKSYIVGSTNSLLLQQKDRYSDILINLDEDSINITSTSLKSALALSTPDRRWIDFITQNVNDTWDDANPGMPKTMGYVGSEEFIRLQFEEYLLSLISSVKYHNHLAVHSQNPRMLLPHIEGDPSLDFNADFIEAWKRTENYRIWDSHTDSHLFDIVEPKHPCAGGLTIDDVQRRIAQQVQDLHLDERFAVGKEVLGRNLAAGKEKASTMFNKLYADMEALREQRRKAAEEAEKQRQAEAAAGGNGQQHGSEKGGNGSENGNGQQTQGGLAPTAAVATVGSKASAYVSSWTAWAGEKRKGWGRSAPTTPITETTPIPPTTTTSTDSQTTGSQQQQPQEKEQEKKGGWGWSKALKNRTSVLLSGGSNSEERESFMPQSPPGRNGAYAALPLGTGSPESTRSTKTGNSSTVGQQRGFRRRALSGESMLDAAGSDGEGTSGSEFGSPERTRGIARKPVGSGAAAGPSSRPGTAGTVGSVNLMSVASPEVVKTSTTTTTTTTTTAAAKDDKEGKEKEDDKGMEDVSLDDAPATATAEIKKEAAPVPTPITTTTTTAEEET